MDVHKNEPENEAAGPKSAKDVFKYECLMYREMSKLLTCDIFKQESPLKNAIVESLLLHTRILVDILISKGNRDDDITLNDICPGILSGDTDIMELKNVYGDYNSKYSPCRTLNKMFAHPTTYRSDSYDYDSTLAKITPLIDKILNRIERTNNPQP